MSACNPTGTSSGATTARDAVPVTANGHRDCGRGDGHLGLTYLNVPTAVQKSVRSAPGHSRRRGLFIAKIACTVLRAALRAACGYFLAPSIVVTERVLLPDIGSLALIAVATPLVAVLFGLPPIVAGLLQDPVDVLREAAA